MAKRIASKIAKEAAARAAAKKGRNAPQSRAISGAPEKGTVGAMKKPKAKPATTKKRSARATKKAKDAGLIPAKSQLNTIRTAARSKTAKVPTAIKAAAIAPAAGLTALAVTSKRKPSAKASEVTFGEAFKAARKKGEGTKFTYKGKDYTAVTKDDLKKKGYDANELRQYMNRKGKARGPLNRLGQGVKKVLLGKDKKFGGDKGAIDFIRRPKKKAAGGMANSKPKKFKAGGMATKGLGKAYMNSKR